MPVLRNMAGVAAIAVATLVALPVASSGPANAQGVSIQIGSPRFGPPPRRVERRMAQPYRGAVWVGGNWRWNGNRYTWISGRWDRPRAGFHRWEDGRWVQRGRNWIWLEGRWR